MELKKLIREALLNEIEKPMVLKESVDISDNLKYHIQENLTLTENIFRVYSKKYFELINEVRSLYNEGKIE